MGLQEAEGHPMFSTIGGFNPCHNKFVTFCTVFFLHKWINYIQ
jgi:hypothetical protein